MRSSQCSTRAASMVAISKDIVGAQVVGLVARDPPRPLVEERRAHRGQHVVGVVVTSEADAHPGPAEALDIGDGVQVVDALHGGMREGGTPLTEQPDLPTYGQHGVHGHEMLVDDPEVGEPLHGAAAPHRQADLDPLAVAAHVDLQRGPVLTGQSGARRSWAFNRKCRAAADMRRSFV